MQSANAGPERCRSAGDLPVSAVDDVGWCACALMLMAFCCRQAVWLRSFAVAANLAFVTYGWLGDIAPVLTLHLVLLPINLVRLVQAVHDWNRKRASGVLALSRPLASARPD